MDKTLIKARRPSDSQKNRELQKMFVVLFKQSTEDYHKFESMR